MPDVIIIGNSGAARECCSLFQDMLSSAPGLKRYYTFKGFLGWQGYPANLKTLAAYDLGDSATSSCGDALLIIGIGKPALRKAVYEHYKAQGANFLTLVHPWSEIDKNAQIGEGNIFQRGSTVFCDTVVGNANYFNGAVNLAHDVHIGDYNFVGPASLILGECRVGSCNMFSPHTTLLAGARVGDENVFMPGSIVYKGCKNRCRMAGNPALNIAED